MLSNGIRMASLLFLALLMGYPAGCSHPVKSSSDGEIPFSPGMVFHRSISLDSDFQIPLAGVHADWQKSQILLRGEVLSVDPDQSISMKITIEKITASLKSLSVYCQYDSSAPSSPQADPNPPPNGSPGSADSKQKKLQAQYEKNFEGIAGSSFLARLDLPGRRIQLDIQDPKLNPWSQRQPAGMIGPDQLALLLSQNSLCEYLFPDVLREMPEKLKSDSSWTSIVWLETPKAPAVPVLKTFTVESITSDQGHSIAKVNCTLTSQIPDSQTRTPASRPDSIPPGPAKSAFQIISLTGTGHALIDLSRRSILQSTRQYQACIKSANSKKQSAVPADAPEKTNTSYIIRQTIEHLP